MKRFTFTLILIIAVTIGSQKNAYSDQPNGEPWSTNPEVEVHHEQIESWHEVDEAAGCGFFCEINYDFYHEGIREDFEEPNEESEDDRELSERWAEIFGGAMH